MTSTLIDFTAGAPVHGDLDVRWIHGTRRGEPADPKFQVHAYDPHTYVLRQAKAVSYEAPFLYLMFGNERALLLDTGAREQPADSPLLDIVDGLISSWLERNRRQDYQLVVAHTHGHGDHVAGDGQFAGRPLTTVVGREPAAVQEFFGFTSWPAQVTTFDLGGRVLEVTGSPGHHAAAITIYDP
ncbi:MAG TPA: MBL fold metallo-hydrolase [Streptosporangiaceae bacterium]